MEGYVIKNSGEKQEKRGQTKPAELKYFEILYIIRPKWMYNESFTSKQQRRNN